MTAQLTPLERSLYRIRNRGHKCFAQVYTNWTGTARYDLTDGYECIDLGWCIVPDDLTGAVMHALDHNTLRDWSLWSAVQGN